MCRFIQNTTLLLYRNDFTIYMHDLHPPYIRAGISVAVTPVATLAGGIFVKYFGVHVITVFAVSVGKRGQARLAPLRLSQSHFKSSNHAITRIIEEGYL